MTTACFTAHGGRSAGMDAAIQRNLENHGVSVAIAPACNNADMNVTYHCRSRKNKEGLAPVLDVQSPLVDTHTPHQA